ncbi:hypothetical protein OAJ07_00620 [Gemmatimonadales bacterium]|nr:hypothetical protein [Gemmatimonadales bacterium]
MLNQTYTIDAPGGPPEILKTDEPSAELLESLIGELGDSEIQN